jgi:hypothetical protein
VYIIAFTKVLTMHQIYHTWIYPFYHSPFWGLFLHFTSGLKPQLCPKQFYHQKFFTFTILKFESALWLYSSTFSYLQAICIILPHSLHLIIIQNYFGFTLLLFQPGMHGSLTALSLFHKPSGFPCLSVFHYNHRQFWNLDKLATHFLQACW